MNAGLKNKVMSVGVISMVLVAAGSVNAQSATKGHSGVSSGDVSSSELIDEVQVGDRVDDLASPTSFEGMDDAELSALPVLDESGTVLAESVSDLMTQAQTAGAKNDLKGGTAAVKRPAKKLNQRKMFGACMPVTGGDNPHESTETGGTKNQVSAHGWWRKGECSGTKATVTACLYELWVADNGTKHWIKKKCTSKDIKPAKKSTNKPRMNVRMNCSNLKYTGWANFVDVDVHGTWDDSLKLAKYSNVYCRVL